ncbi:MAG: chemotaxis protein CheW [Rhodospirillaceae bacterium]
MKSLTSARDISELRTDIVVADNTIEQFIIFTINDQEYGVSIMAVREIRGWTPESKLPNLPPHVRGVINLRGVVIPIIDLRARFGVQGSEAGKTHVVIVMQIENTLTGILVDAISDILPIPRDQIKPSPAMDSDTPEGRYVDGLYTPEGRIIALLDVATICACGMAVARAH